MDAGRGSRMALCLWWPGFELELERVRTPSLADQPLALPTLGDRRRVEMGCALATSFGVEPGMIVSQAIALCPSLVLCEPDPDFHDAARDRVLEVLRRLESDRRAVDRAGPDVRGGRWARTPVRSARAADRRAPGTARSAVAVARVERADRLRAGKVRGLGRGAGGGVGGAGGFRSAGCAAVCVTPADLAAFLALQPVDVLPVSPRVAGRLKRLGVRRLGQLVRMPEPALVSQFGADGRRALAWARGTRIDRVRPEAPARPIRVALDFPSPIGQLELLHAALDRLIGRALEHPRRRGKSVRGLRVSASLEDGGSWSIRAVAREPTSEPERLGAFLRSRIALDRPRRAVETLRLELFRFGPASAQTGLFDPREGAARVARFAGDEGWRTPARVPPRGAPAAAAAGRRRAVPGARTGAELPNPRAPARAHGNCVAGCGETRRGAETAEAEASCREAAPAQPAASGAGPARRRRGAREPRDPGALATNRRRARPVADR